MSGGRTLSGPRHFHLKPLLQATRSWVHSLVRSRSLRSFLMLSIQRFMGRPLGSGELLISMVVTLFCQALSCMRWTCPYHRILLVRSVSGMLCRPRCSMIEAEVQPSFCFLPLSHQIIALSERSILLTSSVFTGQASLPYNNTLRMHAW